MKMDYLDFFYWTCQYLINDKVWTQHELLLMCLKELWVCLILSPWACGLRGSRHAGRGGQCLAGPPHPPASCFPNAWLRLVGLSSALLEDHCCVWTCAPSSGRAVGLTSDSGFFRSSVFALHFTEPPISAQLLAFLRVFCMTEGKNHFRWKKDFFLIKLWKCKTLCVCGGVRLEIKILKWEELFGRGKLAILEKELICCAQGWQSPDILRESRILQTAAVLDSVPGHS